MNKDHTPPVVRWEELRLLLVVGAFAASFGSILEHLRHSRGTAAPKLATSEDHIQNNSHSHGLEWVTHFFAFGVQHAQATTDR